MQKNWPDNDIVNKLFDFIMIHLWKVMLLPFKHFPNIIRKRYTDQY